MSLNDAFARKRADILQSLSRPDDAYTDASPKGSVDIEIREVIDIINASETCVTTSSCAGRIAVFLEAGNTSDGPTHDNSRRTAAAEAGDLRASRSNSSDNAGSLRSGSKLTVKGSGGRWLFVSHEPLHITPPKKSAPSGQQPTSGAELSHMFGLYHESGRQDNDRTLSRFVHFKFEPMVSTSFPPPYLRWSMNRIV